VAHNERNEEYYFLDDEVGERLSTGGGPPVEEDDILDGASTGDEIYLTEQEEERSRWPDPCQRFRRCSGDAASGKAMFGTDRPLKVMIDDDRADIPNTSPYWNDGE
jgi:hypothetical protein